MEIDKKEELSAMKIASTVSTIAYCHATNVIIKPFRKEQVKTERGSPGTASIEIDKVKDNKQIEKKRPPLEEKIRQVKNSSNEKGHTNVKNIVNKVKLQEKYEKGR